MKTLVLCIDGLGRENLDLLPLPKLRKLINSSCFSTSPSYLNVLERGWPAIYLGRHVAESGCYYQVPLADNSLNTTVSMKTGLSSIPLHLNDQLVWHQLNQIGLKVGVFLCSYMYNSPKN